MVVLASWFGLQCFSGHFYLKEVPLFEYQTQLKSLNLNEVEAEKHLVLFLY